MGRASEQSEVMDSKSFFMTVPKRGDAPISTRYICTLMEVVRHYHQFELESGVEHIHDRYYIKEVINKYGPNEADRIFKKVEELINLKIERDKIEAQIRVVTDNWRLFN
jgi:hypothetical protein